MSIAPNTDGTEKVGTPSKQYAEFNALSYKKNGVEMAESTQAIDTLGAPTDNTSLDATGSAHGLMPKASVTKLAGIEALAEVNPTDAEIAASYATQVAQISAGEITAGTETALRTTSPANIVALIAAHESADAAVDAEQVQDWVGTSLTNTDTLNLTHDDGNNQIFGDVQLKTAALAATEGEIGEGTGGLYNKLGTTAGTSAAGNDSRFLTTDEKAAVTAASAPAAGNRFITLSDLQSFKLDDLAAPDATTDLDATTSLHGLMPSASVTKLAGIEALAEVNPTDAEIATAYQNEAPQVSAGEITNGTETAIRSFSPDDVEAFVATHTPQAVSAGEITAATETALRGHSPADIKSFVTTHSPTAADAVSAGEIAAGTETELRSYSPADVVSFISTHESSFNEYIKLSEVQASATSGGTATIGSWEKRVLNTEDNDDGNNCSLVSSVFTLQPGTYRISASAPAADVHQHQIRLRNTTDGTTTITGQNSYAEPNDTDSVITQTHALLSGQFTIASAKAFEIQHKVSVTQATYGHGGATGFDDEVYTVVELYKVG